MITEQSIEQAIRRARLPGLPALALLAATVLCELPVLLVRMLLTLPAAAAALLLLHGSFGGADGYWELALIPTAWSLFALITPVGGAHWWRINVGGREPSEREHLAYNDAIALLRSQSKTSLRLPRVWFVLDAPPPDAAVCGDALMLSRGLIESEFLAAVLAHELGHLASSDGKLTASLNRLVITPLPWRTPTERANRNTVIDASERTLLGITLFGGLLWLTRRVLRFACGGLALRLLGPFWGSYWREREYAADRFAVTLGQGEELAEFLEVHALLHDNPVPFIWLSEQTHPPSELRIDRLHKAAVRTTAVAPGPEPVKAAPAGPPSAGPDGPALTEPVPSAEEHSGRQGGPCRPSATNIHDQEEL
jgi:Zn-dependent protease with chaperone function